MAVHIPAQQSNKWNTNKEHMYRLRHGYMNLKLQKSYKGIAYKAEMEICECAGSQGA